MLLSNPEFQTQPRDNTWHYLFSQPSMLSFYLITQIRKRFALLSLGNYWFPVHNVEIICDYKQVK